MPDSIDHLTLLGPGYTARAIVDRLRQQHTDLPISATARSPEKAAALAAQGIAPIRLDGDDIPALDAATTHILVSTAPPRDGASDDIMIDHFADQIVALPNLRWIGYLSSTNVYGDHGGAWVDEETPPAPTLERGARRVKAESLWQGLAQDCATDDRAVALNIFRLAGIYGPGRSAFDSLRAGRARRVIQDGQVFSRIHVADIAEAVARAMVTCLKGGPFLEGELNSRVYNLADDLPAPPQDVIEAAALMLGLPIPKGVALEDADLSPMARSFYADCKRVRAERIKADLALEWRYPNYRVGLSALLDAEEAGFG